MFTHKVNDIYKLIVVLTHYPITFGDTMWDAVPRTFFIQFSPNFTNLLCKALVTLKIYTVSYICWKKI